MNPERRRGDRPIDRVDGARRRTTTRRDRAPRPSDACRTRDDRSIDRARRLDATRTEPTRIAHRDISAFGGYDDCRHAANRIARAERDATRRDDRGESRDRVTIADVERARARSIEMERAVARATGRGATTTTRRDDDARRRDATTGRDASDASDASDAKGASDERRWGSW